MNLSTAYRITAEAFDGIFDKGGRPYFEHCLAVAQGVSHKNDDELTMIALMHDLIEDTDWELAHSEQFYYLKREYKTFIISKRVYDGLILMTHSEKDSYIDYILKIGANIDTVECKISDLKHNTLIIRNVGTTQKDLGRIEKYFNSYNHLETILKEYNEKRK